MYFSDHHQFIFLIQSEDLLRIFTSIEEAVDNNKLSVRQDKAIHADLGK